MLFIGFAGGSGSGKTTLVRKLAAQFLPYTTLLSHDDYYKAHHAMTIEERAAINYDEPDAIDNALFLEHLQLLRCGKPIHRPVYDYQNHDRMSDTVLVEAKPILLAEGILLFADAQVTSLFDLRIFVDTDADIRFIRRLYRDTVSRGRTLASVSEQYQSTVKPMHEKYVEPQRHTAHIIVPENGENPMACSVIAAYIHEYLEGMGITTF